MYFSIAWVLALLYQMRTGYSMALIVTALITSTMFFAVLCNYAVMGQVNGDGNILLAIYWVMFALLVSLNIPEIRRNYISSQILKFYKAVLPKISQTEKEAIDAGGIWWDGEIFSGNPNWDVLRNNPKNEYTKYPTEGM